MLVSGALWKHKDTSGLVIHQRTAPVDAFIVFWWNIININAGGLVPCFQALLRGKLPSVRKVA